MFSRKKKPTNSSNAAKSLKDRSSDNDIVEVLKLDSVTRKKFYSKFCWYHENITSRNTAETKLRMYREQIRLDKQNKCIRTENKGKITKHSTTIRDEFVSENDCVYLVRPSVACNGEYILSYLTKKDKYVHYRICLHSQGVYILDTENAEEESVRGVNNIIDLLVKENNLINEVLTIPLPDGHPPPSIAISHGYCNPLHDAISNKLYTVALKILSKKDLMPGIDDRDIGGSTALHIACRHGHEGLVIELLQCGASVSAIDEQYFCALHLACIHNFPNIVRILLQKGNADPQMRSHTTGNVALHIASEMGHLECVLALLEANAVVGVRNYAMNTPTELAKASGNIKCLEALDKHQPPPASTEKSHWFHESIDRQQASEILDKQGTRDGLFLVRPSKTEAQKYVLDICFKQEKKRYIIDSHGFGKLYCISNGPLMHSLEHLIEYYSKYSDGLTCKLAFAVSPLGVVTKMYCTSDGNSRLSHQPGGRPPSAAQPMVLDRDSLELGPELGQGEYGSVLEGTWMASPGQKVSVAIKTLTNERTNSDRDGFLREAQVMVGLEHSCIVKLIGICQHGKMLMLVQELLPMGSLLDFLLDYPEKVDVDYDQQLWSMQISDGMMYLESQHLVHRDLAARNILLAGKDQVKIGDFGLSRTVGANDYYKAVHGGKWPVKWYAPESINYGTFSGASDVWSFGVTMWEIYSLGEQPYGEKNGSQVIQMLERGGRLEKPTVCSPAAYKLMQDCWKYKPQDRPTFKQLHERICRMRQSYENVVLPHSGGPPSIV